jgi:putative hydrolase of the HAD superfamily
MTIRAVTFDATRTLFSVPGLGREYARILARHGLALPEAEIGKVVPVVWQEFAAAAPPFRDRFSAHPEGARGFWRAFVERVVELAGGARPSRFASAELFEHFATPAPYRVFPDVAPALDALAAAGVRLGVVSNWDARLARVLEGLGLAGRFATVIVSADVGVEKPHTAIFEAAAEQLGCDPAGLVHVGDSVREDVEGAIAAGWGALHLARGGGGDLESLAELPAALARAHRGSG